MCGGGERTPSDQPEPRAPVSEIGRWVVKGDKRTREERAKRTGWWFTALYAIAGWRAA